MVKSRSWARRSLLAVVLAYAPGTRAHFSDGSVVYEWNRLLQQTMPAVGLQGFRFYAMLHIAMFDAINSIEERSSRTASTFARHTARRARSRQHRQHTTCSRRSYPGPLGSTTPSSRKR